MLCQFTFSNFKSYRDEVTLDLCPANISEHPETLIVDTVDKTQYLPVAAIYGPNGGGKSNVIEAFAFLKKIVTEPLRLDDDVYIDDAAVAGKKYFIFDAEQKNAPSSFEVIFRRARYEYKYIIKIKDGAVAEENLYATHVQSNSVMFMFERDRDNISLGEVIAGVQTGNINPAMPFFQYLAAAYDFDIVKSAMAWFKSVRVINYANTRRDHMLNLPTENENRQPFYDILQEMDIPIKDIQFERNEEGRIIKARSEYQFEDGQNYYLDLNQESSGTRKLLSFLKLPLNALKNGSTLFVDELDAKLHPKMFEYIIRLFTDPVSNKLGAQLIFTSHDLYTMNNSIFRRDEIWFAAKGADLSSRLYSLSEFKKTTNKGKKSPRKDENYGKQYIEGRYGADPYLKKIVDWEA